jgi:hypothetical protein
MTANASSDALNTWGSAQGSGFSMVILGKNLLQVLTRINTVVVVGSQRQALIRVQPDGDP